MSGLWKITIIMVYLFFFFSCLLWRAFIEFHIGKWAQCCLLKTCGITVPINLLTEGRAWGSGRFRQLGSSGVSQRSAPWRGAGQGQGGKQRKNLKQNFSLVMVSLHLKFCVYKLEFREIRLLLHISKIWKPTICISILLELLCLRKAG